VFKMHYPYLAAVIYDDSSTLKDFHPSLTDDFSCVHNVHHKPSMVNSNPDLFFTRISH